MSTFSLKSLLYNNDLDGKADKTQIPTVSKTTISGFTVTRYGKVVQIHKDNIQVTQSSTWETITTGMPKPAYTTTVPISYGVSTAGAFNGGVARINSGGVVEISAPSGANYYYTIDITYITVD